MAFFFVEQVFKRHSEKVMPPHPLKKGVPLRRSHFLLSLNLRDGWLFRAKCERQKHANFPNMVEDDALL
jgi:hypothetical protein